MRMYYKPVLTMALIAVVTAAFLSACSTTALPPGKSIINTGNDNNTPPVGGQVAAYPSNPGGFAWANQSLKATGQGQAPEGMPTVQAGLAAKNSARVHALTNLKAQIKALPVGTDQTVGSITDGYITIRHAVEQEIAQAQDAGSRQVSPGTTEVEVQLPLRNISNILQQYQITTDQELPAGDEAPAGVPDMI